MTVYASKPEINVREKLKELESKKDFPTPAFHVYVGSQFFVSTKAGIGSVTNRPANFFDTVTHDNYNAFDLSNSQYNVPVSGLYYINLQMIQNGLTNHGEIQIDCSDGRNVRAYMTQEPNYTRDEQMANVSLLHYFNAGDEFHLRMYVQGDFEVMAHHTFMQGFLIK